MLFNFLYILLNLLRLEQLYTVHIMFLDIFFQLIKKYVQDVIKLVFNHKSNN